MKQILFDGRIGKDGAEVRTTNGGRKYVRFSVANNSFVGGKEKTEWFDVTSYDPYVIEKKVQYLTKGTYVLIGGNINTEVKVANNKVWVNQYITATSIDTPSFKKKEDTEGVSVQSEDVSTYSAAPQPAPALSYEQPSTAAPSNDGMMGMDDDLPF